MVARRNHHSSPFKCKWCLATLLFGGRCSCLHAYGTVPTPGQASGSSRELGGHHQHSRRFCHCTTTSTSLRQHNSYHLVSGKCSTYTTHMQINIMPSERLKCPHEESFSILYHCTFIYWKKTNQRTIAKLLSLCRVNCEKDFSDPASRLWYGKPNST